MTRPLTSLAWATPVPTDRGRPLDLRQTVQVGDFVIGHRYEPRPTEVNAYGGVDVIEFGKVSRVFKGKLRIMRPDHTPTEVTHKIARYERESELANARAVWDSIAKGER